ncbi:hypothetical protein ACFSDD_27330 [Salipiger marinus]|uniref:hypothetical protein n=1 Tax=Salipiger marinus TaxID=555512 RepID=UPI00363D7885
MDDYVSIKRAALDYGVVIKEIDADLCEYEVDEAETEKLRAHIRENRVAWARIDPEKVAEMYRKGEIDAMDAVRRYAVILDWETASRCPRRSNSSARVSSGAAWRTGPSEHHQDPQPPSVGGCGAQRSEQEREG